MVEDLTLDLPRFCRRIGILDRDAGVPTVAAGAAGTGVLDPFAGSADARPGERPVAMPDLSYLTLEPLVRERLRETDAVQGTDASRGDEGGSDPATEPTVGEVVWGEADEPATPGRPPDRDAGRGEDRFLVGRGSGPFRPGDGDLRRPGAPDGSATARAGESWPERDGNSAGRARPEPGARGAPTADRSDAAESAADRGSGTGTTVSGESDPAPDAPESAGPGGPPGGGPRAPQVGSPARPPLTVRRDPPAGTAGSDVGTGGAPGAGKGQASNPGPAGGSSPTGAGDGARADAGGSAGRAGDGTWRAPPGDTDTRGGEGLPTSLSLEDPGSGGRFLEELFRALRRREGIERERGRL